MMKPKIHAGGTSGSELAQTYMRALRAVEAAADTLSSDARPHGRDYYVQGRGAFSDAIAEHRARLNKLHDVEVELELLADHCANAVERIQSNEENYDTPAGIQR